MNKEHHGRTNQPQTSWVPLPLGEDEAVSARMSCYQTGGGPGRHFLHPSMRVAPTTTQDLQKGEGVSFSIKT